MRTFRITVFLVFIGFWGFAQSSQTDLSYYLPKGVQYDPNIPTPKQIIGHEVGEWHITHDKLMFYMQALAKSSNRISIENRGSTFEGRPILLLTITSPKNHGNLEQIRQDHLKLTETGGNDMDLSQMPIVVYQGFSIHGNEPSGSNAALAYAYHLAAAQGSAIDQLLDDTIILLDPSFNPDGLQRFAFWANMNKAQNMNPDPNDREYTEVWPRGRTNHYWFDMNRDWLPVQLPESRARIASFHKWLPNVLTDHHEMGSNSTFFFQPGEPSRVHPLTPKLNQELTAEIGTYHAKALNQLGSLYYSEENYDDYYYGKGSTFPDVNGSIGILFEQGSSRGHMQETENGLLTFPFTIRNQFATAVSTVEAAQNMRGKILEYQRSFYADTRSAAAKSKSKAIVFGDAKDPAKAWHLAEILKRHNIQVNELAQDARLDNSAYKKGAAYIVPMNQKNHRLIQAMFEKRTSFTDSLFYDVSAWTFPLAFNLDYTQNATMAQAGARIEELKPITGSVSAKSQYAYLFEWNGYYSPKALNAITQKGLRAKVAKGPFSLEEKSYGYGTIMVPVQGQKLAPDALHNFMQKVAQDSKLEVTAVSGGLTQGIDLGSNEFDPVRKQKVALLVGGGVTSYDAGEIWHLFDTRFDMKLTKLDVSYFNRVDLSKYTDLIIPNAWGNNGLDKKAVTKIKSWVKNGGTLIAYRNATQWLKQNELMNISFKKDSMVAKNLRFDQKGDFYGAQVTGGAIFNTKIDRSHPIVYGYKNDYLPMFRNTNLYMEAGKNSFDNPIQYTQNPLLSGYISEENLERIKGAVPFKTESLGRGRVIAFTDNTNFRAFWYGTNKLLMNAIFFGGSM